MNCQHRSKLTCRENYARIADPCLGATEGEPTIDFLRGCRHSRRVRTVVRLSETEAANELAGRQSREVLLLELLGSEGV
jgi:hypothetical protein